MRLGAWVWLLALPACQLVAGITDVSSNGPCTDDRECPRSESCVSGHCQTRSGSSGAGSGGQAGTGGSGVAADGGQMGGGRGGSSASGGASGTSATGGTVAQGGDAGDVSGSGGSVAGDSGEGGTGETTGAGAGGGVAGSGGAAGSGGTAGGGAGSGADGGTGMVAGSSGSSGMAGTGGTGPIRIMPLGDGITAGTCMRAFLWQKLRDNAFPAFDFVGTRVSTDTCLPTDYDKDNEGHSGYRVSDVLSETSQNEGPSDDLYTGSSEDLDTWFNERPADIVLMLLGSNDFLSTDYTADDVKGAYSKILTKLRSINPRVTLLVGLLPPMRSTQCDTSCESRRSTLNSTIPSWVISVNTLNSHVDYVDLSGMSVDDTTNDGVKPNDVGAEFLAGKWYEALDSL